MNWPMVLIVAGLVADPMSAVAFAQAPPPAAPSNLPDRGGEPATPLVPPEKHMPGTYCYTIAGACKADSAGAVSAPCTCPGANGQPRRKGTLH
jgi:hypothetical protein